MARDVEALLASAQAAVRAAAAATLGCVSDSDSAGREAVVSCGGVEALLSMLDRGDANGELEAIHAICSLADHTSSHAGLALGLASLVALLKARANAATQ